MSLRRFRSDCHYLEMNYLQQCFHCLPRLLFHWKHSRYLYFRKLKEREDRSMIPGFRCLPKRSLTTLAVLDGLSDLTKLSLVVNIFLLSDDASYLVVALTSSRRCFSRSWMSTSFVPSISTGVEAAERSLRVMLSDSVLLFALIDSLSLPVDTLSTFPEIALRGLVNIFDFQFCSPKERSGELSIDVLLDLRRN